MPIARHRVLSPERRAILKRAQGNAYQGSRAARGGGHKMLDPIEALGHAHTCQYIAGEPSIEASTCGKRSKAGSSYCVEHHAICYDRAADPERSAAGRKAWETRLRRYGARGLES